ncbi:MAG: twin-arginine translocation signal domain-containing protein [Actinobacteria bacterium]|nr:MAG: twin-arginine translocation signal domain-containing protein [Actinomycetota bacterium]
MEGGGTRRPGGVGAELTRRGFLKRTSLLGLGAMVASALPVAKLMAAPPPALADVALSDATLQAFADTVIPGRRVAATESSAAIDPAAIAGVDPLPGAVEADALALYHHPEVGFDALEGPFLAELASRSLPHGGDFLRLPFDARVSVVLGGLDFANPTRLLWEAAAAVPFTAFCAAALVPEQTADKAVGYRVMGLPGKAPTGYRDFSYRRALARERTRGGSLS